MKTFILAFPKGDYNDALLSYMAAKDWVVDSGMFNRDGVDGIIQSPLKDGQKLTDGIVPQEFIHEEVWHVEVELTIYGEYNERWLKELTLPPGATLTEKEAKHAGGN